MLPSTLTFQTPLAICGPLRRTHVSKTRFTAPHNHRAGLRSSRHRETSSLICVAAAKATFSSFNDMVASGTVLVDFYASWCGPCVMMAQIIEEVNKSTTNVKFVKVNTEKYPKIASQYSVQALPTLVLFKDGKAISRAEGVLPAVELRKWLDQSLQKR